MQNAQFSPLRNFEKTQKNLHLVLLIFAYIWVFVHFTYKELYSLL